MDDELERGRDGYRRRAWAKAYESLSAAAEAAPLEVEDVEKLAVSAYLVGRDDESLRLLERAHHAHLSLGEGARAARSAFWLGLHLLLRGETARATGWLARARRQLEDRDCVEQGYLLVPEAEQHVAESDHDAAYSAASEAVSIGDRFDDADLVTMARHLQGRILILRGQMHEGLAMLDEAMVSVTTGELSPIVAGLIYCSVIAACQEAYALRRAGEWTSALAQWCDLQPEMVAFTGRCLVHRAEIMQLRGAWPDALEEANRACKRFSRGLEREPPAAAFYQQGEVHRLRGEFTQAEAAYRYASQAGREPQPGLALLWLAQQRPDAAAAAIRRAANEISGPLERTRLLPAYIEIMLAVGAVPEARDACNELENTAARFGSDVLGAMVAHARGTVALAEGDAQAALSSLRRAAQLWQEIEAPYAVARARALTGRACRALGDEDGGVLELEAARTVFEQLGAAFDLAQIDLPKRAARSKATHGLTPRELEVLRLVATGKTNKAIATELFVSEKTVDRHVSNIFTKLDVSSRSAATAYSYDHDLL